MKRIFSPLRAALLPWTMGYKIVIAHGLGLPPECNYLASASPRPRNIFWLQSSSLGYNYYITCTSTACIYTCTCMHERIHIHIDIILSSHTPHTAYCKLVRGPEYVCSCRHVGGRCSSQRSYRLHPLLLFYQFLQWSWEGRERKEKGWREGRREGGWMGNERERRAVEWEMQKWNITEEGCTKTQNYCTATESFRFVRANCNACTHLIDNLPS